MSSLYHHGILGQKWGKKNGPPYPIAPGDHSASEKKANPKIDENKKEVDDRKNAVKNRRTLSDAEIQKRIDRIKREKTLKDLTEEDLNPGKKAVKDILKNSGKKVAGTVVTGATLYAIKIGLTKKFNPVEFAKYVAPAPKNK